MREIGFKLAIGAAIALAVLAFYMAFLEAKRAREYELRFCTRWLQLATPAESLKVYKLRPTCLSVKEDQ